MKTPEQLIAFEKRISDLWEVGQLPFLIHLSGGNEKELCDLFREQVRPGDWILSSHRNHFHALLAGMPEDVLEQRIKDGNSMFCFSKELNFLSSAILGGMCGIAAGVALAIQMEGGKEQVWCFLGDGAEDNGHFYEAAKFSISMGLPVRFVIEDNDRSCGVARGQRGSRYSPAWDSGCVIRIAYRSTWPHAGNGTDKKIVFDSEIVKRFAK